MTDARFTLITHVPHLSTPRGYQQHQRRKHSIPHLNPELDGASPATMAFPIRRMKLRLSVKKAKIFFLDTRNAWKYYIQLRTSSSFFAAITCSWWRITANFSRTVMATRARAWILGMRAARRAWHSPANGWPASAASSYSRSAWAVQNRRVTISESEKPRKPHPWGAWVAVSGTYFVAISLDSKGMLQSQLNVHKEQMEIKRHAQIEIHDWNLIETNR